MKKLQLKVCGMRETQNIKDVLALQPDMMGFIFFDKSSRNAESILDEIVLLSFPKETLKVGVFVDAEITFIHEKANKYGFQFVQLHGNESVAFCQSIKNLGLGVLKAFSIDEKFDFEILEAYAKVTDYFLFDTKGKQAGGNGIKFDWVLLTKNSIPQSFFISGGVDLEDIPQIIELQKKIPQLVGIDVNSKFEEKPAFKNIDKLINLTNALNESK